MDNPFYLHYLNGWEFQLVLDKGGPKIEARGFGVLISSMLQSGESPHMAADRIVYQENSYRRSLRNSWVKGNSLSNIIERTYVEKSKAVQFN